MKISQQRRPLTEKSTYHKKKTFLGKDYPSEQKPDHGAKNTFKKEKKPPK